MGKTQYLLQSGAVFADVLKYRLFFAKIGYRPHVHLEAFQGKSDRKETPPIT
jgi:hypothetical protein